jgi:hypothetical protein
MDEELIREIAEQLMTNGEIETAGEKVRVKKTSRHRLRTARFQMDGREYEAIEQNAEKPSRWGKLAREGRKVVQFRDVETGKYVAVVVDGKVRVYGKKGS